MKATRRWMSSAARLPPIAVEVLTPELAETFRADGAVKLSGVLTPGWVKALREAAEANLSNPGPLCDEHSAANGTKGRFHDDQFLWKRHDAFRDFVTSSGAGALAAKAMSSQSAHIFYDQLLVKEPGTAAPTPWHNDTSYWQLSGSQICSLWVALDDVPSSVGVVYVKGSHKWKLRHPVTNFSGADTSGANVYGGAGAAGLTMVPDVEKLAAKGEFELLKWDMRAGDVLVFDSAALHGAPGNTGAGATRRRGYATRWCGDDVTFDARAGTMAAGWTAAGYDTGLSHGSPIACALHPNVLK